MCLLKRDSRLLEEVSNVRCFFLLWKIEICGILICCLLFWNPELLGNILYTEKTSCGREKKGISIGLQNEVCDFEIATFWEHLQLFVLLVSVIGGLSCKLQKASVSNGLCGSPELCDLSSCVWYLQCNVHFTDFYSLFMQMTSHKTMGQEHNSWWRIFLRVFLSQCFCFSSCYVAFPHLCILLCKKYCVRIFQV